MDKDFNNQILEKIKTDHIEPRPRWQFLLRDSVVWIFGVILLAIGSLSISVLIYLFRFNDWEIYEQISDSFLGFVLLTLPYFWIILLVIFILIINYNIKHTKKGYKYRVPAIVIVSIFLSTLFGAILFRVGVGQAIDDVLGENVPLYERFINPKVMLWENPEAGRLSGLVVGHISDCEYNLVDRKRNEWLINIEKARGSKNCELVIGRPIKMIGELDHDMYFIVSQIMMHGPGRGIFGPRQIKRMPNFNDHEIMMEMMTE